MAVLSTIRPDIPSSIHDLPLELIWDIASRLTRESQRRLALSCKYLLEAIAVILWRSLHDLRPLFGLLPTGHMHGGGILVSSVRLLLFVSRLIDLPQHLPNRSLMPDEWNRWDIYAPHVRQLRLTSWGAPILDHSTLRYLYTSLANKDAHSVLLPRLRTLSLTLNTLRPLEADFISLFLGPKLKDVELGCVDGFVPSEPSEKDDAGFSLFTKHLLNSATLGSLTHFTVSFPGTSSIREDLSRILEKIPSLLDLRLGGCDLVDDNVLHTVGQLPNLERFHHIYSELQRFTHPRQVCFPSIKFLNVPSDILLWSITGCSPHVLNDLEVELDTSVGGDFDPWLELIDTTHIWQTCYHALRTVEIRVVSTRPQVVAVIGPLLGCAQLEALTVDAEEGDYDIDRLSAARSWANLTTLACSRVASGQGVSLETLAVLSQYCPSLFSLKVPVDAAATVDFLENDVTRFRSLGDMYVSDWIMPPGDLRAVIETLKALGPVSSMRTQIPWSIWLPFGESVALKQWLTVLEEAGINARLRLSGVPLSVY